MDRIKVLIADDEENIRAALEKVIDWNSIGAYVCASAYNGKDALEKIKKYLPDILLMDIRMPGKSGLEVIQQIRDSNPDIKAIVLSGYDDFSYAQQAISLGAVNYLLKPSLPEQILSAVDEVCRKIRAERLKTQEKDEKEHQILQNQKELHDKTVAEIILTHNEQLAEQKAREIGFPIGNSQFCIVISPPEHILFFEQQKKYIIQSVETIFTCQTACLAEDIVVLVSGDVNEEKAAIQKQLLKLKSEVSHLFNVSLSIAVGNNAKIFGDLYQSYEDALKIRGMFFFLGTDFVMFYDSIYSNKVLDIYPVESEKEIFSAIEQRNIPNCMDRIDFFFSQVAGKSDNKGAIVQATIVLLLSAYHFMLQFNIEMQAVFDNPFNVFEEIQRSKSIHELEEKIKFIFGRVITTLNFNKTGNDLVDIVIGYIQRKYMSDIFLSNAAQEAGITPAYLSTLFKQTLGQNFVDYLSAVRIEKGCELLKNSKLKTYEISYQVGFRDEKYFTKVFKKLTGISPSEYKQSGAAVKF
jgi:two-component system, response regulator YesN